MNVPTKFQGPYHRIYTVYTPESDFAIATLCLKITIRWALKLGTLLIRNIELINFNTKLKFKNINNFVVINGRCTFANLQGAETFKNDIIFDPSLSPNSLGLAPKAPRKNRDLGYGFIDFLHKIDDFEAKISTTKNACGAISLGPLFLRSKVGDFFCKSLQIH